MPPARHHRQWRYAVFSRSSSTCGPSRCVSFELSLPEQRDLDPAAGHRKHGKQTLEQHLVQRIGDLASLARVLKLLKMFKLFDNLIVSAFGLREGFGHRVLQASLRTCIDSVFTQPVTHRFMQWP